MSLYRLLRPLVFCLNAETAHDWTIGLAGALSAVLPTKPPRHDPILRTRVAGIDFPSPVGLAAGFDKDAKAPKLMFSLGFGFVEVGTVTPEPQFGNEPPRVFRLKEHEAIINRFGFNSDGHSAVAARLAQRDNQAHVLGVNIGTNKASSDRIRDYVAGVERFAPYARYITVNVSSPNTPGLRLLQDDDSLPKLIERVIRARDKLGGPPIFLKVAPDLTGEEIVRIAKSSLNGGIDALIVANTTVSRPGDLATVCPEAGGLSGAPVRPLSLRILRAFHSEVGGRLPLIGSGGISTAEEAYERIRAGASLIQIYTALVYHGPSLVRDISRGIAALLRRDGFASLEEAVGADEPRRLMCGGDARAVQSPVRGADLLSASA
ncbi:MAG TPA: quinone-dependent dihydroorotate dehydrogenase [Allosphingosinicella sp.]|jgi:dihydroorotate dehydrogenase